MSSKDLVAQLRILGLTTEEARCYLELLKEPSTHLRLSRALDIDRAKIYRLVEQLEKRSLVARRTDDRGTFLVATDASTLEVELADQEQRLQRRRTVLREISPQLASIQTMAQLRNSGFNFKAYDGQAGLKQMCWHELKTKGEILTLGHGNIEILTADDRWAEKHRIHQVNAGYYTRDLVNEDKLDWDKLASKTLYEADLYDVRVISSDILCFDNQTVVYNDTVAVFHWQQDKKVGMEIISLTYANMMRQLFEHYWSMAKEVKAPDRHQ
jgi:DNA-binding MarR family transcriptional regulator